MKKIPSPINTQSQTGKRDLCIIGTNETAERITQFVERYNLFNIIGYAVDKKYITEDEFKGKPVWAIEELEKYIDKRNDLLFVALFWNHLNGDRRRLYERLKNAGWHFANIISPLASIRGSIGENCWIMDYVVTQENSTIGDNVFLADFACQCFTQGDDPVEGSHSGQIKYGALLRIAGGNVHIHMPLTVENTDIHPARFRLIKHGIHKIRLIFPVNAGHQDSNSLPAHDQSPPSWFPCFTLL